MIDITNITTQYGKVLHNLDKKWTWDEVKDLLHSRNSNQIRNFKNAGFTISGLETHLYCSRVLRYLHPLHPTFFARCGMYVSLLHNSETFGLHQDIGQYLWIWQILGNTLWEVEGESIYLKQNEILFISPDLYHRALPDSPRASITFSLEQYDN